MAVNDAVSSLLMMLQVASWRWRRERGRNGKKWPSICEICRSGRKAHRRMEEEGGLVKEGVVFRRRQTVCVKELFPQVQCGELLDPFFRVSCG